MCRAHAMNAQAQTLKHENHLNSDFHKLCGPPGEPMNMNPDRILSTEHHETQKTITVLGNRCHPVRWRRQLAYCQLTHVFGSWRFPGYQRSGEPQGRRTAIYPKDTKQGQFFDR